MTQKQWKDKNWNVEEALQYLLGFLWFIVHSCSVFLCADPVVGQSWSRSHSSWIYFLLHFAFFVIASFFPLVFPLFLKSLPLWVILASDTAASFLFFLFLHWLFFWDFSWDHTHTHTHRRGEQEAEEAHFLSERKLHQGLITSILSVLTHTHTQFTFN